MGASWITAIFGAVDDADPAAENVALVILAADIDRN